jgi:hypothetical protein
LGRSVGRPTVLLRRLAEFFQVFQNKNGMDGGVAMRVVVCVAGDRDGIPPLRRPTRSQEVNSKKKPRLTSVENDKLG